MYAFIGFIFYILAAVAGFIGLLIVSVLFATIVSSAPSAFPTTPPSTVSIFPFMGIIPLIFLFLLIPAIILTYFAWTTVKAIDAGRIGQARTYSLILGIVGLVLGTLIGGIFFLLAYANLGESRSMAYPQRASTKFCINCGNQIAFDDKFCPYCGKEQPV